MENRERRWGVQQRLEFIEFQVFWKGELNRSDIMNCFRVSKPQASNDLSEYQDLAPNNLRYDRSRKRYFPSDSFELKFLTPDADRYLAHLTALTENSDPVQRSWLDGPTQVDALPVPHRRVDVRVLRFVLDAMRTPSSLEIFYQSMNFEKPEPQWRWVTPKAFVSDGLRWHLRSFCHVRHEYRDFTLSRCMNVGSKANALEPEQGDLMWSEFFDVVLTPNPDLSEYQRKAVAYDYEMVDDRIVLPVRRALLYYFKKRLRLDVAEALDAPSEAPVVIENRMEFDAAMG